MINSNDGYGKVQTRKTKDNEQFAVRLLHYYQISKFCSTIILPCVRPGRKRLLYTVNRYSTGIDDLVHNI